MKKILLVLLVYALLGGFGVTFLKKGLDIDSHILNAYTIIGGSCYLISFIIWIKILRSTQLIFAFPVASGALFASILIFSFIILKEHLTITKSLGIIFILSGIFISSKG